MKKGEKMNNDLVLIGHISRDIVIDHLNQETKIVGGAVIYAASAIAQSGLNLTVISKLPKSEESLKKDLMKYQ
jgi:sugar/nucleoside kinase (ribokinase family)